MKRLSLFTSLFTRDSSLSAFGARGIRRQRIAGALTIIGPGLTSLQRGVESPEVGISVETYEVRYHLRVNEILDDNVGEVKGEVRSQKFSRDFNITGEVTGATGLMALTQLIDCTSSIANDKADFGDGTGIILLDEATVTQGRAVFRKVALKLHSNPTLTALS
jgi:hypothetical protein